MTKTKTKETKIEFKKLREPVLPKGELAVKMRGVSGEWIEARLHPLNETQRGKITSAIQIVQSRLKEPNHLKISKEDFLTIVQVSIFLRTQSKDIGAYSAPDQGWGAPAIILNTESLIWEDKMELAVTVLHEAAHLWDFLNGRDAGDRDTSSKKEAMHAVLCYAALKMALPTRHWAFKKYPDLLGKITSD
jgi:hypothetical protein